MRVRTQTGQFDRRFLILGLRIPWGLIPACPSRMLLGSARERGFYGQKEEGVVGA